MMALYTPLTFSFVMFLLTLLCFVYPICKSPRSSLALSLQTSAKISRAMRHMHTRAQSHKRVQARVPAKCKMTWTEAGSCFSAQPHIPCVATYLGRLRLHPPARTQGSFKGCLASYPGSLGEGKKEPGIYCLRMRLIKI